MQGARRSLGGLLIPFLAAVLPPSGRADWLDDQQLGALLEQTEKVASAFEQTVRSRLQWVEFPNEPAPGLVQQAADLATSVARLRRTFKQERALGADLEEVLRRAIPVDSFMQRYPLVTGADAEWFALRGMLDRLAAAFQVGWRGGGIEGQPSVVREARMHELLRGLERDLKQFRQSLHRELPADTGFEPPLRENIEQVFEDFEDQIDTLDDRLGDGYALTAEVGILLDLVSAVNRFFELHHPNDSLGAEWRRIEQEIQELAQAFGLPSPEAG